MSYLHFVLTPTLWLHDEEGGLEILDENDVRGPTNPESTGAKLVPRVIQTYEGRPDGQEVPIRLFLDSV